MNRRRPQVVARAAAGVHDARMHRHTPGQRQCILVLMGATSDGQKELLAFYDFPAEHWRHLRTTNPIESTFATVRLRHGRTKGNGSREACLAMVFKLAQSRSSTESSARSPPDYAAIHNI